MARTKSQSLRIAVVAAVMSLPAVVMAADQAGAAGAGERQKKAAPTMTMDVQDLDPEIEAEFEGTRSYLVADRIGPQRD